MGFLCGRNKRIGLKIILCTVLVIFCVFPALAENASSWDQIRNLVTGKQTSTIQLTADVTANSQLDIGNGKNVTIDLNGHTIQRGNSVGTLFNVNNGGKLTINDSQTVSVSRTNVAVVARDNDPSDGTGIGMPASYQNNTLTWYETHSVVTDTIYTTETRKLATAVMKGKVLGGSSSAELIQVNGNGSELTINGGFFHNSTGRAVTGNGAVKLTFNGGYFYNNSGNHEQGGAVYANGWDEANKPVVTFANTVFVGNHAVSGGAFAANGPSSVTIKNGAVFSGNYANGDGRDGGGAIYLGWSANAVMEGGLITHNWGTANVVGSNADSSSYDASGGGILVRGTLLMTGGSVTSNEAAGGGGISTYFWDGGDFSMTGGIVAGNVARLNEGGGILINMNGSASITGGHITNNTTETLQHWGGGGLFTANDSVVTMKSVLISDNKAGGFGGGLAGCSTARIDAHLPGSLDIEDHAMALYGNSAEGVHMSGDASTKSEDRVYALNDPVFMRDNGAHYQDYFCALNTTVCGGMLGGGASNWSGTIDGRAVAEGTVAQDTKLTSQYVTGLTGHPTSANISKARNKALVFVTGNTSGTHGGGILSNGYLIIGTHREMNIGDRMTILGDKTLSGDTLKDDQFSFTVKDDKGNLVTTGTSKATSEIQFAGRLAFEKAGTYTYFIEEADVNIPANITRDTTVYKMVVTVDSSSENVKVATTVPTVKEDIHVTFNKISGIVIYKQTDGGEYHQVAEYTSINSNNADAYLLPYTFEFVNRAYKDTGIVVSKTVHDQSRSASNDLFQFTVQLSDTTVNGQKGQMTFTNGKASFTLREGESMVAVGLPANVDYTVTEAAADGYYNANPVHKGTTQSEVISSVVFENYAVGALKVAKKVESVSPADKDRIFTFKLTLLPGEGINGNYAGVVFENGVAYFELKDGQSITIPNLLAGLHYQVDEVATTDFATADSSISGTIAFNHTSEANFLNTRHTGELHVKKYVIGGDNGESFPFTVELIDGAHISGTFGDMTFTNGKAVISLKHGETARATGLPTGLHYRVREQHNEAYAVQVTGSSDGVITSAPSVVEFTNTRFSGLVIGKEVTGTIVDRSKSFQFEITLSHPNATLKNQYGGLTFTNGTATFSLSDGEHLILEGLPNGTLYTVKELDVDQNLYLVHAAGVAGTSATGEVTNEHAHVDFVNNRRVGKLQVTKKLSSPLAYDASRVFGFTVTVSEPINGRFGDMVFENGKAEVYLMPGQTAEAINMPAGMTYEVTETADHAFDTASTGASGQIVSDQTSAAVFSNTRRVGGLKITKAVRGEAVTGDEFGFKLLLDREINGTFGDLTFTNGVAEFTLTANASVTVLNLPEDLAYTLIETSYNADRYAPVVARMMGDIENNVVS